MPKITWETQVTIRYTAEVDADDFAAYTADPETLADIEADELIAEYAVTERDLVTP
jgi:hypothetical protein